METVTVESTDGAAEVSALDVMRACARDPRFLVQQGFVRTPLGPLPSRWEFFLDYLGTLDSGDDCLIGKSRQMLGSWGACWVLLHRLMFRPGYSALITSRKEPLVDDGGDHSTVASLMGRIRYLYENLPGWVRESAPVTFTHLRAVCGDAYLMGESTTPNSGRGGTFDNVLADEWAFVPQSELTFASLRAACRRGIWLLSTPNGPLGNFARLWREKPPGFRVARMHWTQHPLRYAGEVDPATGRPTSDWYRQMCEAMTPDDVARELDISFERSTHGLVYPEFSSDVHVYPGLRYDAGLPLWLGLDPGIGAPTAGVFFQVHGAEMRVLADYEQANAAADVNAQRLKGMARQLGFDGEIRGLRVAMDPAANARDLVRGSTVAREYEAHGFSVHTPREKVADGIRMLRRKFHRREIYVSPECDLFVQRVSGYRYPVDDSGNVKGDEPVHDICSHMMDGFRYGATSAFGVDEWAGSYMPQRREPAPVVGRLDDGVGFRAQDDDAFAPIMGRERNF